MRKPIIGVLASGAVIIALIIAAAAGWLGTTANALPAVKTTTVTLTKPVTGDKIIGNRELVATADDPTLLDHVNFFFVKTDVTDAPANQVGGDIQFDTAIGNDHNTYHVMWNTTDGNSVPNGKYRLSVVGTYKDLKTATVNSVADVTVQNGTVSSTTPVVATLHDPGPGNCVDGKQILQDNKGASRTVLKAKWTQWLRDNSNKPCVAAMATSVGTTADKLADWINTGDNARLRYVGAGGLTVVNTYFDHTTGAVKTWQVQQLPAGELVFFGPNNKPLFLFACGNVLKPFVATPVVTVTKTPATPVVHKPVPEPTHVTPSTPPTPPTHTSTTPPTTGCTSNCAGTPPSGCTSNCTSTPPTQQCASGQTGTYPNCTTPPTPPTCSNSGSSTDTTCGGSGGGCTGTAPSTIPNGYVWDSSKCKLVKHQSNFCKINPADPSCPQPAAGQTVQNNTTSGSNTGTTPGASSTVPVDNKQPVSSGTSTAPNPTANGSNSGHANGSTTATGTTSDGAPAHTSTGSTTDANGGSNGIDASGMSNGTGHVAAPSDT